VRSGKLGYPNMAIPLKELELAMRMLKEINVEGVTKMRMIRMVNDHSPKAVPRRVHCLTGMGVLSVAAA